MLDTVYARVQAAEDTRRADETIAVRDAEIGTMRTTIESVTTYHALEFTAYVYRLWMMCLGCLVSHVHA
jgi:hypothetical protein